MKTLNLQYLETIAAPQTLGRGEHLFFEDDPSVGFFTVESGLVKVYKVAPDGREQVLRLVGPGECFAECSIFGDECYPANAEAVEPSKLWLIPKAPFLALLRVEPELALKSLGSMADALKRLLALVETLSLKNVEARLAEYLLARAEEDGRPANGSVSLTLNVEKKMIAAYLGTISETMSRSLRRLKDRGVIREEGFRIFITDVEGLHRVAAG